MRHISGGIRAGLVVAFAVSIAARAQEFKLFDRTVQVHGFASQGFVHTNDNNWLTMNTSHVGSGQFTDFGANASVQVTDRFRIGAQIFGRELGQLGRWHPQLDWAVADLHFQPWLNFRAGKIKTAVGLYNDTQDEDFLHTFVLLPQGVYPTDMRDSTLSHIGGDLYGTVDFGHRMGKFSYTAYGGELRESIYGGYPHLLQIHGIYIKHSGGPTVGGDLRWKTPVKGLLAGISYEKNMITNTGILNPSVALGGPDINVPYQEWAHNEFIEQYYGEYTAKRLRIDSEYRRFWRSYKIFNNLFDAYIQPRSWYGSASYRLSKRVEVGGYYSHTVDNWVVTVPRQVESPNVSDPDHHLYDKAISARIDLKDWWYAKVEGHFMDGYAGFMYPDGFYPQVNSIGACPNNACSPLEPSTNAVIVKSGFYF